MQVEPGTVRAPELGPEWVNSPPLTLRSLRGRAVLVDFWDYTCVNCLRTLPYLVEWHRRYSPNGLTIMAFTRRNSPSPAAASSLKRR